MATVTWEGGAPAVAQVDRSAITDTWTTGDLITVTINGKAVVYTLTAGDTTDALILTNAALALEASTMPEFAEIAWANFADTHLEATSNTAGKPVTWTIVASTAGDGDMGAVTNITASSGPNDYSTAANYDTGTVPVNDDDLVIADSSVSILYGLDQAAVALDSLTVDQSFLGTIGLPRTNTDGTSYVEYRLSYLTVEAPLVNIGRGVGVGSGRLKIDNSNGATTLFIHNTGDRLENALGAVIWKGTHASNVMQVTKGTVSVAPFAGEVATIATLKMGFLNNPDSDAWVECGDGLTLTTIDKSGGQLFIEDNSTTITQTGGEVTIRGIATVTTLTIDGGTGFYESSGTCATANLGGNGTLDFRRDNQARTVTNINVHSGAVLRDSAKTVTWTNGIDLIRCRPGDVTLDIGTHQTLTPSAI